MQEEVEEQPPSLCWEMLGEIGAGETATQFTLTFGYLDNEPTAALYIKDNPEIMALIPKEVLGIAFQQGWTDTDNI